MILIDFQQIMIANLSRQLGSHTDAPLDESMLRHMVLNSLRAIRMKFKDFNGDIVIACDSRSNWRKKVYPYYKANRAKKREESGMDWKTIFESFAVIKAELKEFFPYRVIEVDGAEGDDVIGVLANHFGSDLVMGFDRVDIKIVSGDKDYAQLQKYDNVSQWDHVNKRDIRVGNAKRFLAEQIIRGDTGDGVPNFLSDDDVLVTAGKRQKPVMEAKLDDYIKSYPDNPASETLLRNWKRNQQMIDLDFVPEDIRRQVLEQYESEAGKTRAKLVNFFISRGLKNLHSSINDF